MSIKNKYNIYDKVRVKISYKNDKRKEVNAIIRGITIDDSTDEINYKILFELDEAGKGQGGTDCIGYIKEKNIIKLYSKHKNNINIKKHDKELIEKCISAINRLPNAPNGHSDSYDKATIERVLRNIIDD